MESKYQKLLEEIYQQISEGKYLNNYGFYKGKAKGSPLSDFDDSELMKLKNDERNAGLEDDAEISFNYTKPSSSGSSPTTKPAKIDVDLSALADKEIKPVMWDYPDVVIQINGKSVGPMFSKEEGTELVKLLKAGDVDNDLVQRFLLGAKTMGDLDKIL